MSLRLRLILAFLVLSVLPLGAVTVFTYLRNVEAMREAAGREAELLAGDLTERMRFVTAGISQRFERLMVGASGATATPVVASASDRRALPTVAEQPAAPGAPLGNEAVAAALGEAAILLNNIEVRDFRPPQGGRRGRGVTAGTRGAIPPGEPSARLGGPPPTPDTPVEPGRIRIDLAPVRRDLLRQLVPTRETFEQLTPEERAQIFETVNERMLDIRQGIEIVQEQVTRQAGSSPSQTQRRTALSGSRLDVRLEQDGEVIGQVNADVNLSRLLATVFTTTPRERDEVPFAVDRDGRLYTRSDEEAARIEALDAPSRQRDAPPDTVVLGGWVVATTDDPNESGLRFGIARPLGPALGDLRRATAGTVGLGLALIGLAIVGIIPLSSRLTRNLTTLSEGVGRIAAGDYRTRVEASSQDEFGALGRAFNQMAADVEQHQQSVVQRERLRRELELGRQIQDDMLPKTPFRLGLTEVRGVSVPALEVGGDFFNYFLTKQGRLALLMGDVSGKGVGAALLMANLQASLRARLDLGQDLTVLAGELDQEVEAGTPGPVYATLFVGLFDPDTHQLDYVNAGHNPQYVVHEDGGLERMAATGLPIGLLAGRGYAAGRVQLVAGDTLFFYTDGCVEAENSMGDVFGASRLESVLLAAAASPSEDALVRATQAIGTFRADHEVLDDATMMVVRVG
jgi:serine phosphatase RsbU (regulator of sigma subunit)